jgi:hypothetical protein
LAEQKGDRTFQRKAKPAAQKKVYTPAPIPSGATLLMLPAPGVSPQPEPLKHFLKEVPRTAEQIVYSYSEKQKVVRFQWPDETKPKGRDKTYRQLHIDKTGKEIWKKGDDKWLPYRLNEVLETLKSAPEGAKAILLPEGESSVELVRGIGIAALTLQGNTWNDAEIKGMVYSLGATGKEIVLVKFRDNDQPGITKAAKVQETCNRLDFPCIVIDPRKIYPDIPEAGDIREILEAIGADEFLKRLNTEIASQSKNTQPRDTANKISISLEPNSKYKQSLRLWKKARTYTATVQSDSEFVQLPEPGPNTITCIKAGLGRGKTQWLAWLTAVSIMGKFLLLGHRNALLRGTCKRIGAYHIRIDDGQMMIINPDGRVASCVDSLLRFPDDCAEENTTIILDEVESLRLHILKGGTISAGQRPEILRRFAHLLNTCSRIILLDGHLTDETVSWIASLAPGKAVSKYENTFKAKLPPVTIYRGGAPLKPWQVEAFKNLVLRAERPAVFCDSKDDAIAFYKQLEDKHGEGKGLLLTADTVGEEWQGEFMDCPDESIPKHQWAFIVATPLLQDGVDISTIDYFSEVFGMFGGVVSVNSVCQMVRRVRHPIGGIKILCAERGYSTSDSKETSAESILTIATKRITNELAEHEEEDRKQIYQRVLTQLLDDPNHLSWFDLAASSNLERPYLYDFVCELLSESGHEVTELNIEKVETAEHKIAKEEGKQERAEAVAAAKIITVTEAEKIKKRHSAKREDILACERAILADRLPGIPITPELVLRVKKSRNLIAGMQNFWYFKNPDKAKQLRRFRWEEGKMQCFASDHKVTALVLQALKNINIGQFLGDGVWNNDSPEVLAVAEWGESNKAKLIDKEIGEGETPIQYLQRLLAVIGVKLVGKQQKSTGRRQYRYLPDGGSLPADFPELFAAVSSKMLERYEEKLEKNEAKKRSAVTSENHSSTDLDVVTPLTTMSLNNNVGEGVTEIEVNLHAPTVGSEPTDSKNIAENDRVQVVDGGEYDGSCGKVTGIAFGRTGRDYYIALDETSQRVIVSIPYKSGNHNFLMKR